MYYFIQFLKNKDSKSLKNFRSFDFVNVFFRKKFIFFLLCFFPWTTFYGVEETDSLESFFGNRFSLYPPTEEESKAVIETIDSFLKHLKENNKQQAYFQDTAKEFKEATSFDKFLEFTQKFIDVKLEEKLDYRNVNFVNDNKTKATFDQMARGNRNFQQFYIEYYLTLEDNTWKITGVKIYETFKSGK